MNPEKITVHDFVWNKNNISQFWNNIYTLKSAGKGFAETAGNSLLKFINAKVKIHGKVLDYGVGYGYLIEYLFQYKNVTELNGVEFAKESAEAVNNRFKENKKFNQCIAINSPILPWSDEYFDFIFITEVIEHLDREEVDLLLKEFNRVLKKGGVLIITVPNNENLESKKVLCPGCGAIFHPVQHLNSYNKKTLEELTRRFNFSAAFCKGRYLSFYQKITLTRLLRFIYYKFNDSKHPNLIGIFIKS